MSNTMKASIMKPRITQIYKIVAQTTHEHETGRAETK